MGLGGRGEGTEDFFESSSQPGVIDNRSCELPIPGLVSWLGDVAVRLHGDFKFAKENKARGCGPLDRERANSNLHGLAVLVEAVPIYGTADRSWWMKRMDEITRWH